MNNTINQHYHSADRTNILLKIDTNYKSLAIGLLISIIAFVPYIGYVLSYNQAHAAEIAKLFQQH